MGTCKKNYFSFVFSDFVKKLIFKASLNKLEYKFSNENVINFVCHFKIFGDAFTLPSLAILCFSERNGEQGVAA